MSENALKMGAFMLTTSELTIDGQKHPVLKMVSQFDGCIIGVSYGLSPSGALLPLIIYHAPKFIVTCQEMLKMTTEDAAKFLALFSGMSHHDGLANPIFMMPATGSQAEAEDTEVVNNPDELKWASESADVTETDMLAEELSLLDNEESE
jgi:hypothetical protein